MLLLAARGEREARERPTEAALSCARTVTPAAREDLSLSCPARAFRTFVLVDTYISSEKRTGAGYKVDVTYYHVWNMRQLQKYIVAGSGYT
ncbi:hypothetical protein E2562_026417 [Oryza meyeriana var. granulata]|uniref:Uncharacterized protein n=1 Tax=Oryza meyeriana var. granulata TaxID=110450 RepID=A0A6G1FCT9_9ORYZ|nr:hypothetical protein E2562_026417 [Oryza meyeriana var. granulata]